MDSWKAFFNSATLRPWKVIASRALDFAVEDPRLIVEFDFTNMPFVFHHGVTPASVRNRRMERTAPLSVSFCGCGR
jgi:hypothetical protein